MRTNTLSFHRQKIAAGDPGCSCVKVFQVVMSTVCSSEIRLFLKNAAELKALTI